MHLQHTKDEGIIVPDTYSNLNVHQVFSTKGRMPLINATLESELYRYMAGIIHGEGGVLSKIGRTVPVNIFFKFRLTTRILKYNAKL